LISHSNVGDVLQAQSKFQEALKAYHDSLAIVERLAAMDRNNNNWQRDLSLSHSNIGNVLMELDRFEEALKSYEVSLAISARLAAAQSNNIVWQRDLSVAQEKVGDALLAQGRLDEALKSYRAAASIRLRLASSNPTNARLQQDLHIYISKLGGLSFILVLNGKFSTALDVVDQAIALGTKGIAFRENRAHALMLLDRVEEARTVYLAHRGHKNTEGKAWEAIVLGDFAEMRKHGLSHPLMGEIEKLFAAGG
jgi:tetratricopeptide (TPR) repeat protein